MKKILCSLLLLLGSVHAQEKTYYSQHDQDKFVHETFFPEKKDGVFVEIGAYDGVAFSNTYFFERELGWTGLCIEPNPEPFAALQNNRKAHCIQGCIADRTGSVKFLQISGYASMLSGIKDKQHPKHLERIHKEVSQKGGATTEIEVPTFTLKDLASKYKIHRIDFLSIDTEGNEWDILSSIDFDAIDIDVITIENNYKDQRFKNHLQSKGYVFIQKLGCDELYKKIRLEPFQSQNRPSLAFIKQFLPKNPIIVEAGAHIGSDTRRMEKAWKDAQIYAFEPSPDVYKTLHKKCRKKKNIKTFQLALGQEISTAKFYPSQAAEKGAEACNAQGSLLPPSKKDWAWPSIGFKKPVDVQVTTLDAWAQKEKVNKVDFLWLDMQGYELAALKGCPEILKTVQVIQTEVSKRPFYEGSALAEEIQAFLESQGFLTIYMTPEDHGDALFVRKK